MAAKRLQLILSSEDFSRLTISEFSDNGLQIVVDVHGMKCFHARRFINNIINTVHCEFQLVIIHGYNHGTAIKNMLAEDFSNSHIEERHLDVDNQGVTHLLIAA